MYRAHCRVKENNLRKTLDLANSFKFGDIRNIVLSGNVSIGENSYINSGRIVSGKNSKITIGENCEMGHNVTILSETHDSVYSTGENKKAKEDDIIIGNNVWIGSNVFIKEGIRIGNNSIIGANSMVIKNVEQNEIVGGVPAKHIKFKNKIK